MVLIQKILDRTAELEMNTVTKNTSSTSKRLRLEQHDKST